MKKERVWEQIKRHKRAVQGVFVILLCLAVVTAIGGVFPAKDAANIPEHDGDVLVDSLAVDTGSNVGKEKSKTETELVTSDDVSDLKNADTYFEEMRATINMDRNQVIAMLTDAEAQAGSSQEKENASKQKLQILHYMEQEQNAENIIKAKGLPQCLVLITDTSVNVTVDKQDLKQSDVAKICDVIMRETGRKAPEIVIQSKY